MCGWKSIVTIRKFSVIYAFVEGGYFHSKKLKRYGENYLYEVYKMKRGQEFLNHMKIVSGIGLIIEGVLLLAWLFKRVFIYCFLNRHQEARLKKKLVKEKRQEKLKYSAFSLDSVSFYEYA
ncbi:hypothetical protein RF11_13571 [Thelohanellus kitauei]|uniref:Uncharacterized protein n=1 Tax=Thelohanellus kitauei TaxID=669202 RepID=A0A0C2NG77_THEKT|nr:hypothetical protein RF11_13571 [Thelohanellus kitauei]